MFKLRNMFRVKDSVPQGLRSRLVCKFSSAGCNASYIGETTRHICTRFRELLLPDKSSHVYKHLQSLGICRDSCPEESFTTPDSAASGFQVKIKDALYIKWEIPNLNQQLRPSVSIFFLFFYFSLLNSFSTTVGACAVLCSQCIPIFKLLT